MWNHQYRLTEPVRCLILGARLNKSWLLLTENLPEMAQVLLNGLIPNLTEQGNNVAKV